MIVLLGVVSGILVGCGVAMLLAEWAGGAGRRPAGGAGRRPAGGGLGRGPAGGGLDHRSVVGDDSRPAGGGERPSERAVRLLRVARALAPVVQRWVPAPTDAARRIDAAGLSPSVTPSDLRAVRGAGVVVGLGLAVVLVPVVGAGGVVLAVASPAALGLVPDLVLRRRASRRAAAMLRALPDTIDLLRIAMRSGRSVPETLARVGAHHHGALGYELRRAAAEVRLGVAVEAALTGLRRRCPAEGMPELVALLMRSHRHGGTVADGLEALADDLRDRRAREAIDRAARAAPKIQLVVALLLVPAAMLLIAAALLQLRGG